MEQEIFDSVERKGERKKQRKTVPKLLDEGWVQAGPGRKPSSWKPGPRICKQRKSIDEGAEGMKNRPWPSNRTALHCCPELSRPDP